MDYNVIMGSSQPLVSVVIPGRNSGKYLKACFEHIINQTYKNISITVVDSNSVDETTSLCKEFGVKLIQFNNKGFKNKFDATVKRNLGMSEAKGEFKYFVDADFELSSDVIKEAVEACITGGADGIIVRELPFGSGFWTKCKAFEQDLHWRDDNVEAPRFFKKEVWNRLGGLDVSLGAGCDDWDLYQRFKAAGYKVARIQATLKHNEGKITLKGLFKKGLFYGRDVSNFIRKNAKGSVVYFSPIRFVYFKHWKELLQHPDLTVGIAICRIIQYSGGVLGVLSNYLHNE